MELGEILVGLREGEVVVVGSGSREVVEVVVLLFGFWLGLLGGL